MARLIIQRGSQVERMYDIDVQRLVIGRSNTCDVVLPVEVVSRQHCEIRFEGGYWLVEDQGSTTGTTINGKRVGLSVLRDGDTLGIGQHTLLFQAHVQPEAKPEELGQIVRQEDRMAEYWEGSEAETAEGPAHQPAGGAMQIGPQSAPVHVSPQSAALGRQLDLGEPDGDKYKQTMMASDTQINRVRKSLLTKEEPHLQIADHRGTHKVTLDRETVKVGYTQGCDVQVPGSPWFGKLQCQIDRDGQGFFTVTPLTSWWCRVRIEGKPLKERRNLRDGHVIEVGGLKMRFNQGTGF